MLAKKSSHFYKSALYFSTDPFCSFPCCSNPFSCRLNSTPRACSNLFCRIPRCTTKSFFFFGQRLYPHGIGHSPNFFFISTLGSQTLLLPENFFLALLSL